MKLKSKKLVGLFGMLVLITIFSTGCGGYEDKIKNHKAAAMYEEGIVSIRYREISTLDNEEGTLYRVSYNVYEDMTEKEMLQVLDYDELVHNAQVESGKRVGEKESDYYCFAIFCDGTSDEIIAQYKYVNHESVEWTEEEKYYFLNPLFER